MGLSHAHYERCRPAVERRRTPRATPRRTTRAMGVVADVPTRPVIDDAPSIGTCVRAFGTTELRDVLLGGAVGSSVGYVVGGLETASKRCLRTPTAATLGAIGLCFGTFHAMQSSAGRLMGFRD